MAILTSRRPKHPTSHEWNATPKRRAIRGGLMSSAALRLEVGDAGAPDGAGTPAFSPLLLPAERAFETIGVGRTTGFALIREGHLAARKIGSRTLVEVESIRRFVAGLPRAGEGA
jgi:hypothetical protein